MELKLHQRTRININWKNMLLQKRKIRTDDSSSEWTTYRSPCVYWNNNVMRCREDLTTDL